MKFTVFLLLITHVIYSSKTMKKLYENMWILRHIQIQMMKIKIEER